MSDKTYNGWSTRQTWLVKLWMDNEEGTYQFFQDQARYWLRKHDPTDVFDPTVRRFAESIKSYHEDALDLIHLKGFAADLMTSAMSEVNWEEIANALLEDEKETA